MKIIREVQTESLIIRLREDGIIVTLTPPNWHGETTLDIAKENMAVIDEFTKDKLRPMLNFLPDTPVNGEARQFYANHKPLATASAMVTKSFLQKVLANFFTSFNKLPIPMKAFSNEENALSWLKKHTQDE